MIPPDTLARTLDDAVSAGKLLDASRANILELTAGSFDPVVHASVDELVTAGQWTELNDRFFKKLAFGTSGLRGRTIGKIITRAEQGNAAPGDRPQFPCVGTNALNYFSLTRANGFHIHGRSTMSTTIERPSLTDILDRGITADAFGQVELINRAHPVYYGPVRRYAASYWISYQNSPIEVVNVSGDRWRERI